MATQALGSFIAQTVQDRSAPGIYNGPVVTEKIYICLLYTSDAADEL